MSDSIPSISSPEIYRPVDVFVARPPRRRATWVYVLFFLLTIFTTLVMGARLEFNFQHNFGPFAISEDTLRFFPVSWILSGPSRLLLGVPFSATLMFILFAHEMGHYLYCRYYGVDATLPFFVPFPSLIGTMGAFIRIKSPIRSRSALFDIGIAGPIAGFLPACVALAAGLSLSKAVPASAIAPVPDVGFPLIFHIINRVLHGSHAVPLERLYLHPVAIAAWVGMFATALNLLPGGQLDGGHIVFSVSPRWHRMISTLTVLVLIPLSLYRWIGWLLWAVVLRITGMRHPIVPEYPEITRGRKRLSVLAIVMLGLTFTPTPITNRSLLQVIQQIRSGN